MAAKRKKRPHLGRGLQSLLSSTTSQRPEKTLSDVGDSPNFPPDNELSQSVRNIPIKEIKPNPYQPRSIIDPDQLQSLADSIRANGVIQPIIVRPTTGGYELIAGERRLRAAKLASLKNIPALVREASDEQLLELALIENIHRTDLNPIERAKAYQRYLQTFLISSRLKYR